MTLREAAQQALEALEQTNRTGDTQVLAMYCEEVIPALRAALAEREPTNECLLCKKGLRYVVKRRVKKITQDAPDLTPIEKLEADLRRLANRYDTLSFERYKNEGHASPMFHSYSGQHYAYIAAAEKVRMLRSLLDLSANVIIKNGKEK
jgi:hypothetical protein